MANINKVVLKDKTLIDLTTDTAIASHVLSGDKFHDKSGNQVSGTMTNNANATKTLNAGESFTIPAGYHGGSGKVTANSLASQTSATASVGQILSGQTAYVNGTKITGTMTNRGAVTASLNAGGSYAIPAGYHNGSGKVTANSLSSQTSATAVAADIASGKTAYVNGTKITGTMRDISGVNSATSGVANDSTVNLSLVNAGSAAYIQTSNNNPYGGITLTYPASSIASSLNLVPSKLAEGVTILGVTGSYTGKIKTNVLENTLTETGAYTTIQSGQYFGPLDHRNEGSLLFVYSEMTNYNASDAILNRLYDGFLIMIKSGIMFGAGTRLGSASNNYTPLQMITLAASGLNGSTWFQQMKGCSYTWTVPTSDNSTSYSIKTSSAKGSTYTKSVVKTTIIKVSGI